MASGRVTSKNALLDRADRAIADALATKSQVRLRLAEARLAEARLALSRRLGVPAVSHLGSGGPDDTPWSVSRALTTAEAVLRAADVELGRR